MKPICDISHIETSPNCLIDGNRMNFIEQAT